MIYEGKNLSVSLTNDDFAEIVLDRKDDSVNKFDQATLKDLGEAVNAVANEEHLRGCLLRSSKSSFVVGADITEFLGMFALDDAQFKAGLETAHSVFNRLEDLDIPVVVAIQGYALGGGLEVGLACDYRIASEDARLGVPEVKLGIFPGFGGTIRLPRIIGTDNALEWIALGKENKAADAFKIGVVDAVVSSDLLRDAALHTLEQAASGKLDWRARRTERKGPLTLNPVEAGMVFKGGEAFIAAHAGPNYPAPVEAIRVIARSANMNRDDALEIEMQGFMKVARTDTARNLVGIFLADQYLKRVTKKHIKISDEVNSAAVLGAGIMGGGIAYQSASRGKIPVLMKDINQQALEAGMSEATKLLHKLISLGKIDTLKMAEALNAITPTLSYADMGGVDIIVEAVVENEKIKHSVMAELEDAVPTDTVIASNTSTISISKLASEMKHPERFVGMHFFNPVHKMPLIEVIRGEKSSPEAIATTVAYAQRMGKKPIVVNDCPGFLVNRILFPYLAGFNLLVNKGADFRKIDQVMEKFGWPMGPAYLLDVVGMDTAFHAARVMEAGFPDRLKNEAKTALDVMYEAGRYGQKNNKGFYRYEVNRKGRLEKIIDDEAIAMIEEHTGSSKVFSDDEIIDHLMIPMIIEAARCLEDNIVDTAMEVDMSLVYGLGFPPFRGGALKYADDIGLAEFIKNCEAYADLGKLFQPTDTMKAMAQANETFYPQI